MINACKMHLIYLNETRTEQGTYKQNTRVKFTFDMEQTGKPSRWNTLRAMRVLKYFQGDKIL